MEYVTLTQYDQDHAVINHFAANEMDMHLHALNAERYEAMLASGKLSAKFQARIVELLSETRMRLAEVTAIVEATRAQLPGPQIIAAHVKARAAEAAMASGAPPERAAAIAASDPKLAASIATLATLASAAKRTV